MKIRAGSRCVGLKSSVSAVVEAVPESTTLDMVGGHRFERCFQAAVKLPRLGAHSAILYPGVECGVHLLSSVAGWSTEMRNGCRAGPQTVTVARLCTNAFSPRCIRLGHRMRS